MFEQGDPPAATLACRLVAPLQQVHQDLVHGTTHGGVLTRAHAENLLNEIGDIKSVPLLTVEECRLFLAPGVHVCVIRCHSLLPYHARPGLSSPSLEEGICTIVPRASLTGCFPHPATPGQRLCPPSPGSRLAFRIQIFYTGLLPAGCAARQQAATG